MSENYFDEKPNENNNLTEENLSDSQLNNETNEEKDNSEIKSEFDGEQIKTEDEKISDSEKDTVVESEEIGSDEMNFDKTTDEPTLAEEEKANEQAVEKEERPKNEPVSIEDEVADSIRKTNFSGGEFDEYWSSEFQQFMTQKIKKATGMFMVGNISENAIADECRRLTNSGIGSVMVESKNLSYVKQQFKKNSQFINCIIDYPYGNSLEKVRNYELKCALKLRPSEVTVMISDDDFSELNIKRFSKEIKKLKSIAGHSRLSIACNLERLTGGDIARVGSLLNSLNIPRFKSVLTVPIERGLENTNLLLKITNNCEIECIGNVDDIDMIRKLLKKGCKFVYTSVKMG